MRTDLPMTDPIYPDPIFSANIYCSGRIDEVIHRVLSPWWAERHITGNPGAYLWLMRYAKTGEHLKIRLHGPAGTENLAKPLGQALDQYLPGLPPVVTEAARKSIPTSTPIDAEDHEPADYPDRSWRPTHYGRSAISFGYSPYVEDDVYVALMTRVLSAGSSLILERLTTGEEGRAPHKLLQGLLIQAIFAGFSALGFTEAQRGHYLVYHRDWLLRAALKQSAASAVGPEKMIEVTSRFDRQVDGLGATALNTIREAAQRRFEQGSTSPMADPAGGEREDLDPWQTALTALRAYVDVVSIEPRRNIDPFAEDPRFAPFFKSFHGFANQLGLSPLNEAFAHHLILQATVEDSELRHQPVILRPRL